MTISERDAVPAKRDARCVLPSGLAIDIDRPDLSAIRDENDFTEVIYLLQEKIIDIELQIDMAECGTPLQIGKPYDPTSMPRTKAALRWAKLHREEAARRSGIVAREIRRKREITSERRFITTARAMLAADTYASIWAVVNAQELNGDDQ